MMRYILSKLQALNHQRKKVGGNEATKASQKDSLVGRGQFAVVLLKTASASLDKTYFYVYRLVWFRMRSATVLWHIFRPGLRRRRRFLCERRSATLSQGPD